MSRLYFLASNQSIHSILNRGVWFDTPLNKTLQPIDSSTVIIVKDDESETTATDARISKMVRMVLDPLTYLSSFQGNSNSMFVVEISSRILKCPDILKVRIVGTGRVEYLKNTYVDPSYFKKVHVYSRVAEKALRDASRSVEKSPAIAVSPQFFPNFVDSERAEIVLFSSQDQALQPLSPQETKMKYIKGDLLKSPMQTLVNTVNCVGVMGKGVALAFKNAYPNMYLRYKEQCLYKKIKLGELTIYRNGLGRNIINFPTKGHWRAKSRITDIEEGLKVLVSKVEEWEITSLAIPPLGCGNGGLSWDEVRPLMERHLKVLEIPIEIYVPHEEGAYATLLKKRSYPK